MMSAECRQRQICKAAVLLTWILLSTTQAQCGRSLKRCSEIQAAEMELLEKIRGGRVAPQRRFSYMVSLRNIHGAHSCGGILIDESAVLTAAHCVYDDRNGVVHIGAYGINDTEADGAKIMRVFATAIHPLYHHGKLRHGYDLAVLILPEPVHDVPTPKLPDPDAMTCPDTPVYTLGWGALSSADPDVMSDTLRLGHTSHVLWNDCKGKKDCSQGCRWKEDLFLCLGGDNTCQGDSGGPALIPHMKDGSYRNGHPALDLIVGVTSFGPPCSNATEGVYTRMSTMRSWILSVIKGIELIKSSGLSAVPHLTRAPFWARLGTWFDWVSWVCTTVVFLQLFFQLKGYLHQMGTRVAGSDRRRGQPPEAIPMARPPRDIQHTRRSEIAEGQHQDSFDMHSFESHVASPSPRPVSLKQLPEPFSLKMLRFTSELGQSDISTVYHATVHGADVAVKVVGDLGNPDVVALRNKFLDKTIDHPNVVSILGVHTVRQSFLDTLSAELRIGAPPGPQDDGSGQFVLILTEYCNSGSLETAICEGVFCEDGAPDKPRMLDILFAARDVAQAVEHLHDCGIVHAHLTPRNILLKACRDQVQDRKTCNVELSWLSRSVCSKWHEQRQRSSKTLFHTAPELLKEEVAPSRTTDIFALGVLLWELFTGRVQPPDQIREDILKGRRFPKIPQTCPLAYASLIIDCWHPDPRRRPSGAEIVCRLNQMIALAVRLPGPEGVCLGTSSSTSEKIEAFKGVKHNSPWYYDDMISMYACGGTSSGEMGSSTSHSGGFLKQFPLAGHGPPGRAAAKPTPTATDSYGTSSSRTPTLRSEPSCPVSPNLAPGDRGDRAPAQAARVGGDGENARHRSLVRSGDAQDVVGDVVSGTIPQRDSTQKSPNSGSSGSGGSNERRRSVDNSSERATGCLRSWDKPSSSGGSEDGGRQGAMGCLIVPRRSSSRRASRGKSALSQSRDSSPDGSLDALTARDNSKKKTSSSSSNSNTSGRRGFWGKASSGGSSSGSGNVGGPKLPFGETPYSGCRSGVKHRRSGGLSADTRYAGCLHAGYTGKVCCVPFGTLKKRTPTEPRE